MEQISDASYLWHKSGNMKDVRVSATFTVCGKKKYPLKFFAIFLATAQNFYTKFHTFITHSSSHKIAKQHCIIFNYDKVIKFLR